jgi:hypothetical protein
MRFAANHRTFCELEHGQKEVTLVGQEKAASAFGTESENLMETNKVRTS